VDEVRNYWENLFTGEFSLNEVTDLISSLVESAESIIIDPGNGEAKHALVKEAFSYFDKEYKLIQHIDDMISLPFFLEPFDGKVLELLVDAIITAAVLVFNKTIWKK
jgi:hypothetical protein